MMRRRAACQMPATVCWLTIPYTMRPERKGGILRTSDELAALELHGRGCLCASCSSRWLPSVFDSTRTDFASTECAADKHQRGQVCYRARGCWRSGGCRRSGGCGWWGRPARARACWLPTLWARHVAYMHARQVFDTAARQHGADETRTHQRGGIALWAELTGAHLRRLGVWVAIAIRVGVYTAGVDKRVRWRLHNRSNRAR